MAEESIDAKDLATSNDDSADASSGQAMGDAAEVREDTAEAGAEGQDATSLGEAAEAGRGGSSETAGDEAASDEAAGGGLDDDEFVGHVEPIEEVSSEPEVEDGDFQWYILKVQSNRERSICDGLTRRVKVAGLDDYFGEVIVPTEDVAEFKNGKRRVVKRKLYPGYIVVHMVLNEETWFLVRETPGIGDFTGAAGKPTPMLPEEVERIVKAAQPDEQDQETIKTAIPFKMGDRVRIKEGTFENFEGDIEGIDEANGRVTVMINIFGRSTPVELEHWQIESV